MNDGRLRPRAVRFLLVVALMMVAGACSGDDGTVAPPAASSSTTVTTAAATATTTGPATTATTATTVATGPGTSGPGTAGPGTTGPGGSPGAPGEVTIRATVSSVFASARVLLLDPAVDGYSEVGLTSDTEYRKADRSPGSLQDVDDGSTVEVTGAPGAAGTLIARLVVLTG